MIRTEERHQKLYCGVDNDDPLVIFAKELLTKKDFVVKKNPTTVVRKSREETMAEFEAQFYSSRSVLNQ